MNFQIILLEIVGPFYMALISEKSLENGSQMTIPYQSRSISNPITTTMTIANGTFSETSCRRLNSTNIDLREMPILEESENSHSNSDNRNGDAR